MLQPGVTVAVPLPLMPRVCVPVGVALVLRLRLRVVLPVDVREPTTLLDALGVPLPLGDDAMLRVRLRVGLLVLSSSRRSRCAAGAASSFSSASLRNEWCRPITSCCSHSTMRTAAHTSRVHNAHADRIVQVSLN